MQIAAATNLACPIDGLPIEAQGAQRRCTAGHSFDVAREGYCNLLVVQHKASRDPGDSKDMVAARRRFLETGLFEPIADRIFKMVRECVAAAQGGAFNIVDAGCGEGYYLDRLSRLASASTQPRHAWACRVRRFEMGGQGGGAAQSGGDLAGCQQPQSAIPCGKCRSGAVPVRISGLGGFQEGAKTRWPRAARRSGSRPPPRAARNRVPDGEAWAASPARGSRSGWVWPEARGRVAFLRDADAGRDDPGPVGDDTACSSRAASGAKRAG